MGHSGPSFTTHSMSIVVCFFFFFFALGKDYINFKQLKKKISKLLGTLFFQKLSDFPVPC